MKNKNISFRANSSFDIGRGHIMRDLVLAKKYYNDNIIFATENLDENINHKIIEAGYKVHLLKSNNIKELENYIDLLVIDSYSIDYDFKKKLKKKINVEILSFDDTYENHYYDSLLNHNIYGDMKKSKDLEEAYQDTGQFYWKRLDKESSKIMFGKDSIPVILPRHLVQDIDTLEDWKNAEMMYKVLEEQNHAKDSI